MNGYPEWLKDLFNVPYGPIYYDWLSPEKQREREEIRSIYWWRQHPEWFVPEIQQNWEQFLPWVA